MLMMASVIWFMAYGDTQADKNARIKEIRAVYAQAKKKIDMNGKNGKSPKDMNITKNHLIDEEICIPTLSSRNGVTTAMRDTARCSSTQRTDR